MAKPTLPIPTFNGSLFMWIGDLGTAEASDLPASPSRVWKDACDTGFYVKSPRTGSKVLFILNEIRKAADGELLFNSYESACGKFSITIFND